MAFELHKEMKHIHCGEKVKLEHLKFVSAESIKIDHSAGHIAPCHWHVSEDADLAHNLHGTSLRWGCVHQHHLWPLHATQAGPATKLISLVQNVKFEGVHSSALFCAWEKQI